MIVLFTDFGLSGPYVGQMKAVLHREAPGVPVVDLFHDVPAHDPMLAAYLLAAYVGEFPQGAVFLGVVDPGVGSKARLPAVVMADGRWFVGPDNGLFNMVARRAGELCWWEITWRPKRLSATFHGRDLFAPVAARLATGETPPGEECEVASRLDWEWPEELSRIVYIDRFGNAMTGTRALALAEDEVVEVNGRVIERARTFSEVPPGQPFWYENANGLAEIAVNKGRADELLGLEIGLDVSWRRP